MALKSAVAYSRIDDSFAAGVAAMKAVISQLDEQKPDFLLLFTTVGHNIASLIQGIHSIAENIPICGCSGAGTITNLGCDEATHSFALIGLQSDSIRFHPFIVSNLSIDAEKAGKKVGETINSLELTPDDQKLLFLFPDGLTINADKLFKGINSEVNYRLDFVGGTASSDFPFSKTYQFYNQEILSDAVSGVLLAGDFNYIIGISHGCRPIGNYRTVTKAQDNIVYEIDYQPALEVLQSVIGANRLADLIQVNLLGIGQSFEARGYSEDIIARAIMGFDEEQGSLQLGAQIPVGSVIRFTRRDKTRVKRWTQTTAQQVMAALKPDVEAAYFYFNCVGRGSYLFGDSDVDLQSLLDVLGHSKDLIGFFTLGEIAPVTGESCFHNYTGVLVGVQ